MYFQKIIVIIRIFIIMNDCFLERAFYYWRHGLYGHVKKICEIGYDEKSPNLFLVMFKSMAISKLGKTNEAIHTLSKMKQRKDLSLIYNTVTYCIHLNSKGDNDFLVKLKKEIYETVKTANSHAIYYASYVCWLFQESDLLNLLFKQNEKLSHPFISMKTLEAWILLTKGDPNKAMTIFDDAVKNSIRTLDLFGLYGKALCHASLKQYLESNEIFESILSKYNFPELIIERLRMLLSDDRWGSYSSLLKENSISIFSNLEIKMLTVIEGLYCNFDTQTICSAMDDLYNCIIQFEKDNWRFIIKITLTFITLSSQNLSFVDKIIRFAYLAYDSSGYSQIAAITLGFCYNLLGNNIANIKIFNDSILSNDHSSILLSLEFQIRYLISANRFSEVEDIIDLYGVIGNKGLIYYTLYSKFARKQYNRNDFLVHHIFDALKIHFSTLSANNYISSFAKAFDLQNNSTKLHKILEIEENCLELNHEKLCEFFLEIRLDIIIEAFEELILYNTLPLFFGSKPLGMQLFNVLESFTKFFHNYSPFLFFSAILYSLNEMDDDSLLLIQKILLSSTVFKLPVCLTFAASLFHKKGQNELAMSCLENASKEDSTLIKSIDFQILKAQITSTEKNSLDIIINLFKKYTDPNVKTNDLNSSFLNQYHVFPSFQTYIRFIDLCISISEYELAATYILEASKQIVNNSEKILLYYRQFHVYASRNEINKSIENLDKLMKNDKYKISTLLTKGEMYYKYSKNPSMYLSVFQDYANSVGSPKSYSLLGDAYKKLGDFNKAVVSYNCSISKMIAEENENSESFLNILKKIINCFVSDHKFDEAVELFFKYSNLFKKAFLFSINFLRLMIKIKKYQEAEKCILKVIRVIDKNNIFAKISYYELTGIIKLNLNDYKNSNQNLILAADSLETIINNASINAYAIEIRKYMSILLNLIGDNYFNLNDKDKAIDNYIKAISYDPSNILSVTSLFQIYKSRHDIERCQKLCIDYLEFDPTNESIVLLLTSVQTTKLATSIPYLQNVLDFHPTYYKSLVRLVEICARCGRFNLAMRYIKKAKTNDPGLYFIRGLFCQYMGDNETALSFFQKSVQSQRWKLQSQFSIFSILINPLRKYNIFENSPLASKHEILAAQNMLKLIKCDEISSQLLHCDLLNSINTKESIDEAEEIYTQITKNSPGLIPASLGLARCYTKKNNFDKANEILSSILSGKPFYEDFSYFEEAYLIKAYIVSSQVNFGGAQHFILLALELNMCCKKGWEMSGEVSMKRKYYNEAATAFHYCWKLGDHKDLEIGYKYAYCSMKAGKYEEALNVCRSILNIHPEYRDIKERIMIPSYKKMKC